MAYTESMSVFFGPNDPGVTAGTYDGSTTIYGEFNNASNPVLGVGGVNPTYECDASSVAAAPHGKTLVIGSTTYKIRAIEPIGDGATVLLQLEKQ